MLYAHKCTYMGDDKGAKVFMKPHLKIGSYSNLFIVTMNSSDGFTNFSSNLPQLKKKTNFCLVQKGLFVSVCQLNNKSKQIFVDSEFEILKNI